MELKVISNILKANDQLAAQNQALLNRHQIYTVNLMSSPGAGKTTLLEALIEELTPELRLGVIEGDLTTAADGERIAAKGVPVVQINTGGGCHLEAGMVAKALADLPLPDLDLLIIENVGNLVCPAEYNLGEHDKIVILSTSEGDDKPLKYPAIFRKATALIINKIDLIGQGSFDLDKARAAALGIQPRLEIFPLSAWQKEGLSPLVAWLRHQVSQQKTGAIS